VNRRGAAEYSQAGRTVGGSTASWALVIDPLACARTPCEIVAYQYFAARPQVDHQHEPLRPGVYTELKSQVGLRHEIAGKDLGFHSAILHSPALPCAGSARTMKALSIRQPWASLIVAGYKDIENRSWRTSYRGSHRVKSSPINASLPGPR
jgi:hypothetical protein